MGGLFIKIVQYLFGSAGKRILTGMGLGLVTSTVMLYVLKYYIGQVVASLKFGGLMSTMIGLLGLAKIDVAISIVLSAYVVKFTIMSTNLTFTKLSK